MRVGSVPSGLVKLRSYIQNCIEYWNSALRWKVGRPVQWTVLCTQF